MSPEEFTNHWIAQLKAGDGSAAAQELWNRYFEKLIRLARKKMLAVPRRVADEEDVVLSAFNSFFEGVNRGRFPQLNDRDDLWRVLVTITARKATAQRRHQGRQKRGGGEVRGESAFVLADPAERNAGIEMIVAEEPSPAFSAEVADEYHRLIEGLGDLGLRKIAVSKMEGYSNIEIADQLGCAVRSVERKLKLIRQKWDVEVG